MPQSRKRPQKSCAYPHCQEPEDIERNARMCSEHTARWMCSTAFIEASRDDGVRFMFSLSRELGVKELVKLSRRWAKAEAKREEAGT